jgi:transposase
MVAAMYVRRTQTRSRLSGEPYVTHRLVRSERVGGRVKQATLLNLGRHFDLPPEHWPLFCTRLGEVLSAQVTLTPVELPVAVEAAVQRYAAQLRPRTAGDVGRVTAPAKPGVARTGATERPKAVDEAAPELDLGAPTAALEPAARDRPVASEIDLVHADTLELLDPRSVGVEALALHALSELGLVDGLRAAGFNQVALAAAVGQIVARMAQPGSERATHAWLQRRSALGELWGFDFQRVSLTRLYQVADALWRQHERVETALYQRLGEVFGLRDTIALYDLTNTYFEGLARANALAKRGHSKEKRSDAPLVTLGLVLDGAGFVRRSEVFAGNVRESTSLQGILEGLGGTQGALVVLDRGIVTEANLSWLREHGYHYLVMSRERRDLRAAQTLQTAGDAPIHWERVVDQEGGDVRLICHSPEREVKEAAMTTLQRTRFESKLNALAASLSLPRRSKQAERVHQRIGRLRQAYPSVARHYDIQVDVQGKLASAIRYQYQPKPNSKVELPGHYVLRSNDTTLDGEALWRTYVQLTDLEAVFRSLKSELGLRPIYHHLDNRTKAHLWISVLAYQCVQFLRRKLKAKGIDARWATLRETLAGQRRITASFQAANGGALHVRKTTVPDAQAAAIYTALGLEPQPGGIQKRLFRPERDL